MQLTRDEIAAMNEAVKQLPSISSMKTLREKVLAALATEAQEPVGTAMHDEELGRFWEMHKPASEFPVGTHVYAHPQPMTDSDWPEVMSSVQDADGRVTSATLQVSDVITRMVPVSETKTDTARHLSNLLARIHRDGGHYEAEHGTDKAVADADARVAMLNVMADAPQPQLLTDAARDAKPIGM